jgi:heme exporter protein A
MEQPTRHDARLAATDLACRRGERVLFSGLGFELRGGEALQIAGPNGIGKTSLLRIAAGLLRPLAGRIERRGDIALLDDRLALDEHRPLSHALAFWRRLDGHSADVGRFGLGELLDVPVRYLSTGQRKRAAFARLAARQAPIWLLDEPLNGLDAGAVELVQGLTFEHCAAGGLVLIASHQPFALTVMREVMLAEFAA